MVLEYIRYSIPEQRRVDFERAYGEASAVLDSSEHCLRYEVLPRRRGARQLRGQDRVGLHRGPRAGLQEEPGVLDLSPVCPALLR